MDGNLTFERECADSSDPCTNLKNNYDKCGEYITIPDYMFDASASELQGHGLNVDVVVYFGGSSTADTSGDCTDIYGFASYCHTNAFDRPIAAYVNLCKDTINYTLSDITYEQALGIVMHETMHGLGFTGVSLAYFRENDENRTARTTRLSSGVPENNAAGNTTLVWQSIRGKPANISAFVVLPTVKQKLTEFYGCDSVIGLELEESGGESTATSHWEARVVHRDIMVSTSAPANIYSIFTFALFEDSGWYQMDWDYAQEVPLSIAVVCYLFCYL